MKFDFYAKTLGGEKCPKNLLPKATEGNLPPQIDHRDTLEKGLGLGLRVTSGGQRSFFIWYRWKGKPRRDTLKPHYPALSLTDARAEARLTKIDKDNECDPRLSGRKPRKHYAPKRVDQANVPGTYAKAVEEYVRRYQEGTAQNVTAGEVKRCLLKFGEAWEGPVSDITARDIRAKLEAIRDVGQDKGPSPYMANRYFSYLRKFFSWCAEPGIEIVETSPMWGMKKPWNGEASRDRVFDDDEIAAIWKAADQQSPATGALVKLGMLTGKRAGALSAMRWSEIDETGLWEPPQDLRRKRGTKRRHAIPIPALGLRIIRALPKISGNDFVFPGRKDGTHLRPGTSLSRSMKKIAGVDDFMFHALRHTVETGMAELRVLPHIRDLVLDHAPVRGAGGGYDHHLYRDEMAEALEAWADHVQGVLVEKGVWKENVIPMGG